MSDMLLNSAVSSLIPTSFGHQPTTAAQHFVGMPLQPPPSGYSLWARATAGGCAADMSPRQQGAAGTSAVSAVLSLSSREAPPVTVAAVPATVGKYMGASPTPSQEHAVMSSEYLKAAQELLDEAVSVSKGVEEASAAAAVAKSAMAVKKKEDSEGGSGGGAEDGGGSKGGGPAEMSTAERQELQMKKSKLANMLDEVEQRYRQYRHQVQVVASSFEAVAGAGSARTYTALAMRTISRQFRCLRDAIAAQVRSASRALGEDAEAAAGGRTVGSRLRFIDHQLRQQRALQKLGTMQGGAWRPQRGLPERSVSILRAWLFEHFLHPYPKDSDRIMLAKQTGLTRSQVSNWFINARVRLWKPMVEEMYLEETKDKDANAAACAGVDSSGGGSKMSNNSDGTEPPKHVDNNGMSSSAGTPSKAARLAGNIGGSKVDVHASLLEFAGDQQAQASFYGGDGGGGASFQHRLKKARTDEPAAFHASGVATLLAQAAATARHDEAVSHRELLMKFMEAGGGTATATATAGERGQQDDDDVGGYSLFTPAPYVQFGSDQYAFAGNSGGVSLTLGLPHGAAAAEHTTPFLTSNSNASGVTAGYDMNMQSTKSFAAQLMRDFVA